jgi:HemY protein
MKFLITGLLLLAAVVFIVPLVQQENGYFLLSYGPWTVEGSLLLLLLIGIVTFTLLYLLIRTLARMWGFPGSLSEWWQQRGKKRAERELATGLLELAEGDWRAAEKSLLRHVEKSTNPLLNYLAAARAAQQQNERDKRDRYLQLAHESMPKAGIAVGLTRAELQLEHHQTEQALATLRHLQGIAPHHPSVLKLLHGLYLQIEDWTELQRLLPELQKREVLDNSAWHQLQLLVYRKLLERAGREPERLPLIWKGVPADVRQEPEIIEDYASQLIKLQRWDLAEPVLYKTIKREWNEPLVELYGKCHIVDGSNQLSKAESWLPLHEKSPALLLALGRLCLHNKLWGKARSYLETSINFNPTAEAYRELGLLLERMGESEGATFNYRAGLELATGAVGVMETAPITTPNTADEPEPIIALPVDPTHPGN